MNSQSGIKAQTKERDAALKAFLLSRTEARHSPVGLFGQKGAGDWMKAAELNVRADGDGLIGNYSD